MWYICSVTTLPVSQWTGWHQAWSWPRPPPALSQSTMRKGLCWRPDQSSLPGMAASDLLPRWSLVYHQSLCVCLEEVWYKFKLYGMESSHTEFIACGFLWDSKCPLCNISMPYAIVSQFPLVVCKFPIVSPFQSAAIWVMWVMLLIVEGTLTANSTAPTCNELQECTPCTSCRGANHSMHWGTGSMLISAWFLLCYGKAEQTKARSVTWLT